MFRKLKYLFLIALTMMSASACNSIYEDIPECEIFLEFVFDYNLDYTDLFEQRINAVDVYIFDSNERLVWMETAGTDELLGRKRMRLPASLAPGAYKVLTVGARSERFLMSTHEGLECIHGITLDDVRLALTRDSDYFEHEFPHLWFTKEAADMVIPQQPSQHMVFPVHLIRETNRFKFILANEDGRSGSVGTTTMDADGSPYTFEVVTPEGAVYSWENEPLAMGENVTYTPYALSRGTGSDISIANLNTVRLFDRNTCQYKLVIRETSTSNAVFQYDFMDILKSLNVDKNGAQLMPHQEFLDRKGDWEIVILNRENPNTGDLQFGLYIEVLDWIVWYTSMEV